MDPISEPTPTKYQQVTVEVPEERVPEFHAFFARFLAGRGRRRRHSEHRSHRHGPGRACRDRHEHPQRSEAPEEHPRSSGESREITEV